MDLLCASIQDYNYNTLFNICINFTSKLSKNYNNIQKEFYLQTKPEQSTSPKTIFFNMYPPRGYFGDKIQAMFDIFDKGFTSMCTPYDHISDKQK